MNPFCVNRYPLTKAAAPRWVKRLRGGTLSPESVARVTAAMPAGSTRFVRPLGAGVHHQADLMAGRVGSDLSDTRLTGDSEAGLLVRKLPLFRLPAGRRGLDSYGAPAVAASRYLERRAPGDTVPYLTSTPRGLFQRYEGPGAPPASGELSDRVFRLGDLGVTDLHPGNVASSGRFLDYIVNPLAMRDMGITGPQGALGVDISSPLVTGQSRHALLDATRFGAPVPKPYSEAVRAFYLGGRTPMPVQLPPDRPGNEPSHPREFDLPPRPPLSPFSTFPPPPPMPRTDVVRPAPPSPPRPTLLRRLFGGG